MHVGQGLCAVRFPELDRNMFQSLVVMSIDRPVVYLARSMCIINLPHPDKVMK
jgi:hypothetical protein